jgi:predicted DNA binding CopG/RHH family protein
MMSTLEPFTIRIDPSELMRVKQFCKKSGKNPQQLIRDAISRHLDRLTIAEQSK